VEDEIDFDDSSTPLVSYSFVHGGWPGDGNIDGDPQFRDPFGGDFHLMSVDCGDNVNSPCIDTGDPALFDYFLDCNGGLGTERSDMGAYGGTDSSMVAIDPLIEKLPKRFTLLQNYPNPFNASTTIRYSLSEKADVKIEIYNILGQKVETLFDGGQQAGYHSVTWRADKFASGIYLARLQAGSRSKNVKMVLLK